MGTRAVRVLKRRRGFCFWLGDDVGVRAKREGFGVHPQLKEPLIALPTEATPEVCFCMLLIAQK